MRNHDQNNKHDLLNSVMLLEVRKSHIASIVVPAIFTRIWSDSNDYFESQRPVDSSQKPSRSSSFCGGALNNGDDGVP